MLEAERAKDDAIVRTAMQRAAEEEANAIAAKMQKRADTQLYRYLHHQFTGPVSQSTLS